MTDLPTPVVARDPANGPPPPPPPRPDAAPRYAAPDARVVWLVVAVLVVLCVASLALAWKAEQRGTVLEQELVRRQQDSADQAAEARLLAKQAQERVGEATAKLALLDARVAEVAVQRGQLEELIQSLSRTRDENLLVEVEAGIRVALQQTAITGSAQPLVEALKQSGERLAHYDEPRLEGVRRAIARDLERVKATSVADVATLSARLDDAFRMVDELPLLAVAETRRRSGAAPMAAPPRRAASGAAAASAPAVTWSAPLRDAWSSVVGRVWDEAKSLLRVTRIDDPDAMLLAPEQSFFVRENLKLRLLNARLALLGRQFDTAQADLQAAQLVLGRYFDRSARRTVQATELIRQVMGQARHVAVPRPDATLAALLAATGGR